jgi:hypothetical protein
MPSSTLVISQCKLPVELLAHMKAHYERRHAEFVRCGWDSSPDAYHRFFVIDVTVKIDLLTRLIKNPQLTISYNELTAEYLQKTEYMVGAIYDGRDPVVNAFEVIEQYIARKRPWVPN